MKHILLKAMSLM